MISIAIQYLEDSPLLEEISPLAVRERLREAHQSLPFSRLMVGWHLPQALLEAVADEAARLGVHLFRWQPLLTGDGALFPHPEWQTVGLDGSLLPGYQGLAAFTFMCPNKAAVQEAVIAHLEEICTPPYHGLFLDRIRFPSPALQPFAYLACFCEDCCRAAQEEDGLDLRVLQDSLRAFQRTPGAAQCLTASLLGSFLPEMPVDVAEGLRNFFRFRSRCIEKFLRLAAEVATSRGMEVGLDCFSPSLAGMVGQDLGALTQVCEWIKVMTYAHARGPAGLPYELAGLADCLMGQGGMRSGEAVRFLQEQTGFTLPGAAQDLRLQGLPSSALALEIRRGQAVGVRPLFAGLELVELPGVCELSTEQIQQDWSAVLETGVDGVVLSWDLWHMTLECLRLVSEILVKYS